MRRSGATQDLLLLNHDDIVCILHTGKVRFHYKTCFNAFPMLLVIIVDVIIAVWVKVIVVLVIIVIFGL
jgi:hypothetical protein